MKIIIQKANAVGVTKTNKYKIAKETKNKTPYPT